MVSQKLSFWSGKKVLITGHTGFKGSWLMLWLLEQGAEVYGYSLEPKKDLNLFNNLLKELSFNNFNHFIGDICELKDFKSYIFQTKPDIIFHLAAQSLVRKSYEEPINTWQTNLIGSLNLLQCLRELDSNCSVVLVTTDKVYKNNEWIFGYRENDQLGGFDPYSASKAALEIAVSSWRNSFCKSHSDNNSNIKIATARAGNVIGGGDWAEDRIIPDIMRSLSNNKILEIRNPLSTRPWQHVLEPLWGYMELARKLYMNEKGFCEAFNFGPLIESNKKVIAAINEMPEAKPSIPSIQLIAFIIPAIQIVVIIKLTIIGISKLKL